DGGSRQERPEVRQWLFVYGTLSLAYQALVLLGLLWFVRGVLAVLHLESLLIVFALFVCSMLLAGPVMTLLRVLRVPGVWQQASRSRMMATAIAFGLLVVAACGIPIPNYVKTPALVRAEDAATIYVTRPGRLVSTVDANRRVATGEVLAQLQDWELEEEVLEANAAYEQQRVHVNAMRSLRSYDPSVRGEYESEKEKLETMRRRCEYLAEELQRLTLRAPRDGWVLPPAVRAEEGEHERLAHWTGTPLDERNRNSLLEERTELCTIGDPAKLEAVLLVNESDVSLISVGQPVKLRVDGVGGSLVRGTIREVSQVGSVVDLRQFGGKGGRERLLEPSELTRPTQVVYQVQVRLDGEMHPLLIGSRGTALVRSNATTVASQCYRFLREHVRSSL
ncbi:MAG: HlyD family efflux transporter periplasmic adaptor subunit, partial [Planctomycetales bacterium]|nr:HlyD family efflux transporter periplasmic adaptor subunit [Planctomycetales bacterium]